MIIKTEGALKKAILEAYRKNNLKVAGKLRPMIKKYLDFKVRKAFLLSPTVDSLINFGLKQDFGLTDPETKIETMIQLIVQSVQVNVAAPKNSSLFRINIIMLRNGLENLYLNPAALQENTNVDGGPHAPGRPDFIPWFEWLTEAGTKVVVSDFFVKKEGPEVIGRSGRVGFMFPTNINHENGFSVPRTHAGTLGNNFVTKILNGVALDAEEELWELVRPVIARLI